MRDAGGGVRARGGSRSERVCQQLCRHPKWWRRRTGALPQPPRLPPNGVHRVGG